MDEDNDAVPLVAVEIARTTRLLALPFGSLESNRTLPPRKFLQRPNSMDGTSRSYHLRFAF
jgi:hypothetical protein